MEQYKVVYNSALKFLVPRTLQQTYATTVKEAVKLVGAKDGSLYMQTDKPNGFKVIYSTNKKLSNKKPYPDGLIYSTLESGIPAIHHKNTSKQYKTIINLIDHDSIITVPLIYSHITIGVITVISKKGKDFTTKDLEILNNFAPLATLAFRNSLLNDQLTQSIQMRDLFISMAAHEFKNPISIILLATELLQNKVKQNKNITNEDLDHLKINVKRLSKMLDEIMNVSKIKQGKLEYTMKKVDLNKILTQNIKEFRLSSDTHKISLRKLIKSALVKGDKDKISRSITNIINNAEKFSKSGSTISCSIKKSGKYYVVSVKDKGKGIDKDELSKIFEHFYRGKRDKNKPGMGLGLYLVKNIVEDHGGHVEVDSKLGKGTTISLYFPAI